MTGWLSFAFQGGLILLTHLRRRVGLEMPPSITIFLEVNLGSDSEPPHPPTEPHKLGCHEPQFCTHSAGAFAAIKPPLLTMRGQKRAVKEHCGQRKVSHFSSKCQPALGCWFRFPHASGSSIWTLNLCQYLSPPWPLSSQQEI